VVVGLDAGKLCNGVCGISETVMTKSVIYLIGSLRNPEIPAIGNHLRSWGFEVFEDWWSASDDADDWLRDYYKGRGFSYKEILNSYAAKHIFAFDLYHLNRATVGVLAMPAGKSGHMELCYLKGQGKPCYVLFDKEPERVDIMYQFADDVFFDVKELGKHLYESILSRSHEKFATV